MRKIYRNDRFVTVEFKQKRNIELNQGIIVI